MTYAINPDAINPDAINRVSTFLRSSLYTSLQVSRHTRREAGIQCQGWQSQIHPYSLDVGEPSFALLAEMTGFETLVYNEESLAYDAKVYATKI